MYIQRERDAAGSLKLHEAVTSRPRMGSGCPPACWQRNARLWKKNALRKDATLTPLCHFLFGIFAVSFVYAFQAWTVWRHLTAQLKGHVWRHVLIRPSIAAMQRHLLFGVFAVGFVCVSYACYRCETYCLQLRPGKEVRYQFWYQYDIRFVMYDLTSCLPDE